MALPISRNRTYTAPSQIASADLNDLQDWVIANYAGTHGDRVLQISSLEAIYLDVLASNFVPSILGLEALTGAVGAETMYCYLPIRLLRGDRVKIVKGFFRESSSAGNEIDMRFYRLNMSTTSATQIGATASTSGSGGDSHQQIAITGLTETVALDMSYLLEVRFRVEGQRFHGVEITYDHPP